MKTILFQAIEDSEGNRDGENGWHAFVEGEYMWDVKSGNMRVGSSDMEELLKKLGVCIEFDYKEGA